MLSRRPSATISIDTPGWYWNRSLPGRFIVIVPLRVWPRRSVWAKLAVIELTARRWAATWSSGDGVSASAGAVGRRAIAASGATARASDGIRDMDGLRGRFTGGVRDRPLNVQ